MFQIKWMTYGDLSCVLDIEKSCYSDPWDEQTFRACLSQKNAKGEKNCLGMVAKAGNRVHGYMIYELHDRYIQLVNIAVHPDSRKKGAAFEMLKKLKSILRRNRRQIKMVVSEKCDEAHFFLRAQGFRAVKVERNFFKVGEYSYEDAYHFCYDQKNPYHHEVAEEVLCSGK